MSPLILPGVLFLLTVAFGFWLSHLGKPYSGILFNLHKLIALGMVVLAVVQLAGLLKNAGSLAAIIALLTLAGMAVIALFASGALMSADKLSYTSMLTIHRIGPAAFFLAMAAVTYLLG